MFLRQSLRGSATVLLLLLSTFPLACQRNSAPAGYIGVGFAYMPDDLAARYGVKTPAIGAAQVFPEGPAYQSGLRSNDLITSIDGNPVTDPNTAIALLSGHKVGDKVRMGIVHLMEDGRLFTIELGIIVAPRPAGYGQPAAPQSGQAPGGTRNTVGMRPIDETTPMGFPKRSGYCQALAPQDWTMNSSPQSDAADLEGANGMAHTSWAIRGVNTAMQRYYGDLYGPPQVSALAVVSQLIAHAPARWTGPPQSVGDFFTAQNFEAGNSIGVSLYHVFPGPAPDQYIMDHYIAWVDRSAPNLLPLAVAVMSTIRCQTILRPPEPSSSPTRPGAGSTHHGEHDNLKDYNVQTGKQWMQSSSGRVYLVDPSTQTSSGPDGEGVYIKSGNSTEKLTPW